LAATQIDQGGAWVAQSAHTESEEGNAQPKQLATELVSPKLSHKGHSACQAHCPQA